MDNTVCLICTAPITVFHLGIQACRACAAFFKRTVIAGRKFTCRQGEKKCQIRKHEKYMCRSCRYDMCVELGMSYELPAKRKPRKVEKKEDDVAAPNSTSTIYSENPSSPSTISVSDQESLIDRMAAEYKASYDRRLIQESAYVVKHNLQPFNHPTKNFFIPTFSAYYDLFKIAIQDSIAILQNVFRDFDTLPIEHRVTLFKNFYSKFSMIECSYLTTKYFPNSKTMFMGSLITCCDINNDEWIEDTKIVRKDAFRVTVRGFLNEYMDLFGPMAKMDELTEREFHAVAILNYCDIDTSATLPEEIIANAQTIRSRVFNELQEYYRKELNLHDFSKRLGNLMTLAHGAGEAGILMNEEMRMYSTMFDVLSDDRLLREFFTN